MCRPAVLVAWVAFAAVATDATAQALYKCRAPDGSLSYQDRECAPDAETLAPPAIAPPPDDPYLPELPAPAPRDTAVAETAPPSPRRPLPRLYHCRKPEGGEYTSATPDRQPRMVPLWTLDEYSPTFGRGLGAPGALYTTVVDACRVLGRGETCAYLRRRLDQAQREARIAFRDRRDALDAEIAELRETIAGCPGGQG